MHKNSTRLFVLLMVLFAASLACTAVSGGDTDTTTPNLQATNQSLQITQTALASLAGQDNVPADTGETNPPVEQPATDQQPADAQPAAEAKTEVGLEGAALKYDASLAEIVPVVAQAALEGPYVYPSPRHVDFTLPALNGVISMVPTYSYELVYPESVETIAQLQTLLNSGSLTDLTCVPELPLRDFFYQCGHQQMVASPAAVNFTGGTGIRFVTSYGIQAAAPVDNDNLRYIYQGLSSDGTCYLSAQFDISHADLPQTGEVPDAVYTDSTGAASEDYYNGMAAQLGSNPAGYTPALDVFDQIIASLEVVQCGVNQ